MKKILIMLLITLPMLTACPFDGKNGKVGAAGPQGIQGAQGVGVQGEQGIQGVAGIQGSNGLACWDMNEDGLRTFADQNDEAVISEDINGDGEINVVDCTGLKGDVGDVGQDCRMGVFITGAYLLQVLDKEVGTLLHTTWVIVDTVLERHPLDGGPLIFGVTALDTSTGMRMTFFRGDDSGLLTGPWVGSCLSPPPPAGVVMQ